jgi:hypothetical protein
VVVVIAHGESLVPRDPAELFLRNLPANIGIEAVTVAVE